MNMADVHSLYALLNTNIPPSHYAMALCINVTSGVCKKPHMFQALDQPHCITTPACRAIYSYYVYLGSVWVCKYECVLATWQPLGDTLCPLNLINAIQNEPIKAHPVKRNRRELLPTWGENSSVVCGFCFVWLCCCCCCFSFSLFLSGPRQWRRHESWIHVYEWGGCTLKAGKETISRHSSPLPSPAR